LTDESQEKEKEDDEETYRFDDGPYSPGYRSLDCHSAGCGLEPEKIYSPYVERTMVDSDFAEGVYWGDTHLHTSYSTDSGMMGNKLDPEKAYRFALGEEVVASHGERVRLIRPLDFLVVADHAENLGLAPFIAESNPELLKSEWGREMHDLVKAGNSRDAFQKP
jgi:hypothetical protein